jgi:hypothetical protein
MVDLSMVIDEARQATFGHTSRSTHSSRMMERALERVVVHSRGEECGGCSEGR